MAVIMVEFPVGSSDGWMDGEAHGANSDDAPVASIAKAYVP
jgi:hypothetical protein